MSIAPGKEGQAGQQIGDRYSSAIPWVAVVRAIGSAVNFGGGGANQAERRAFRAAGGTVVHKGKGSWQFTYQGQRVSERKAIKIGRAYQRGELAPPQPNPFTPADTMPRASGGFPGIGYAAWLALQPRGPRTRKRYKRKKRSPLPGEGRDPYGGGGGALCGTDSECLQWAIDHGVEDLMERRENEAFMGRQFPPDIVPPIIAVPARAVGGVAGAVLGGILGVLWPSEIGPELPMPMPTRPGEPTGPRRRYRVSPRPRLPATMPAPEPLPMPAPIPRVPTARPSSRPGSPVAEPLPLPGARPAPTPDPVPKSRPIPGPGAPSPTTGPPPAPSTPRTKLPFDPLTLLPLLLAPRAPARTVDRYRPPVQSPLPIDAPLTAPFAYGVPSPRPGEKQCECEKRKRKRSTCRNPVTSRTTRTRGGRRYRTITRRLDCK